MDGGGGVSTDFEYRKLVNNDPAVLQKVEQTLAHADGNFEIDDGGSSDEPQMTALSGREARNLPEPLRNEAFYGLAGNVVRIIEPHSETDPAALLMQFLGVFGNVIGRQPHFSAERDYIHAISSRFLLGKAQ